MNDTKLSPGDLRSNAEKIVDEVLKQRVLRGIQLLEETVGPNWVDYIDPTTLYLPDACACVLGQVFGSRGLDRVPTQEQLAHARSKVSHSMFAQEPADGYLRGLAIIDGELLDNPHHPGTSGGFNVDVDDYDEDGKLVVSWRELQRAWMIVFGAEVDEGKLSEMFGES